MNPIISPWLIYFAEVSQNVSVFFLVVGGAGLCVLPAFYSVQWDFLSAEDFEKFKKNLFRKLLVLNIVILLLGLLLPSKTTVYSMILIDNITPQNIETFKDEAKDLIDYTVDKIGEIKQ